MQIPINPLTNNPIPMGPNSKAFIGGRSLLDNIYGASSDPSIQANPPSRFRTNMMSGYSFNPDIGQGKQRTFTNRDMSQFVNPNIDNPLLRNYPALRKIPDSQRQFAKIVDGKVVLDIPEEMEMGTPNQTEKVPSNIPQFDTEQEYLKASGLLDQQEKQPTTGLLNKEPETKETKGLLDMAKDFVSSDYGRNFALGMLGASGYSKMPKSLGQIIQEADQYATNKALAKEELDIKKDNANKKDSRFAYIVKDPNTGNIYNAYDTKDGIVVDVNGQNQPFRNDMFGGERKATISNVGNINDQDITPNKMLALSQDITNKENQLVNLSRYMENVDNSYVGMEKLAVQFKTMMKTILNDYDLTPQELNQKLLDGQFAGLIGQNRLEIVGGGVMTEPDALKIMTALGGDPSNIDTNPTVAIGLMSNIFEQKYRTYANELELYNINASAGGFTNYPKKEAITFNDNFLGVLDPSRLLSLDLAKIPEFTEKQLFRLLSNNTDIDGNVIEERFTSDQIADIIALAKVYGINLKLEDGEIVSGDDEKEFFPGGYETIGNAG